MRSIRSDNYLCLKILNQSNEKKVSGLGMYSSKRHPTVFYGWYIVGACLLIAFYTAGVIHFGFTAVIEPIAEEFGWSYAQISLAASLRGLEVGLLAPVMGILVDRLGPRRIVIAGSIILCTGLILLSRASSLLMFYGAFALIAIGMSTCTHTVLIATVANWFQKKVGIAIGIVASGYGLGGLLVPFVTELIDTLQWQTAMSILGIGMIVIVLPLSLLIRHKPENYGYQPDGGISKIAEVNESEVLIANAEISISFRQMLKHRAFWHVAIGGAIHTFAINAIVTHIMPALSTVSMARNLSSYIALILPVLSIVGRIGGGWLTERFENKKVFAVGFALCGTGLFLFSIQTSEMMWLIVPFVITFSLGWGVNVTTRMSLLREHFGRAKYGTILGFASGIMMLGNVSGAPLAGWIFDIWGSYTVAWLGISALTIVGLLVAITMPSSNRTIE